MNYLIVDNPEKECTLPSNLAVNYTFPLDPFQKHAINAISKEENVLVTAKTGSGKTLVGEYQIAHSLKKGKRIFYTTPIKSLSNQKFHDLKHLYKNNTVGIATGDIKFLPNADIVVMTTEILRNLLYKKGSTTENLGLTSNLSLENLDSVIFDEVHYINNRERGTVWEETLILLPKEINLVLLSATIDSADLFASWLGDLKQKPIHLISTNYRIVPLEHYVIKKDKIETVMDSKEVFYPDAYNRYLFWKDDLFKQQRQQQKLVANRRLGGYEDPVVSKSEKPEHYIHTLNTTIQKFYETDMLPALAFVFSRKLCEEYASKISSTLITSSESAAVKHIIDFHLHRYKDTVQITEQYHTITALLIKGIAFHHSGLLPLLKEIVEILFSKGLVKVLFATETFAVGLNMPTKTVIFTSYRKFCDDANAARILTTDEYIQMAGRAGRRGKDTKGNVFYLPDRAPENLEDIKKMMKGTNTRLSSRIQFNYDFLLKTVQSNCLRWTDLIQQSYYYAQLQRYICSLKKEKTDLLKKVPEISPEYIRECAIEEELKQQLKGSVNAAKKKAQASYEAWKNTHSDRVWEPIRKIYKQYTETVNTLEALTKDIESLSDINADINPYLSVLKELEFLNDDKSLTTKGVQATEINEGDQLLLTNMYSAGLLNGLNASDILQVLSCYMVDELKEGVQQTIPSSASTSVRTVLEYSIADSKRLQKCEEKYGIFTKPHILNFDYINLLQDLINGTPIHVICATHEMFEGNLTRFLLKLLNIVDEIRNIAIFSKDVEILKTLEHIESYEFYKFATPDSLYLRI